MQAGVSCITPLVLPGLIHRESIINPAVALADFADLERSRGELGVIELEREPEFAPANGRLAYIGSPGVERVIVGVDEDLEAAVDPLDPVQLEGPLPGAPQLLCLSDDVVGEHILVEPMAPDAVSAQHVAEDLLGDGLELVPDEGEAVPVTEAGPHQVVPLDATRVLALEGEFHLAHRVALDPADEAVSDLETDLDLVALDLHAGTTRADEEPAILAAIDDLLLQDLLRDILDVLAVGLNRGRLLALGKALVAEVGKHPVELGTRQRGAGGLRGPGGGGAEHGHVAGRGRPAERRPGDRQLQA